jgi:2-keto-4-pentenoate hydratase/2-oxohepta-3-ene-1,7-dioic acid hydratase in catechol pathway
LTVPVVSPSSQQDKNIQTLTIKKELYMRWIRFTTAGQTHYGILEGTRVKQVQGDPFEGYQTTAIVHDLSAVKIEIPVMPRTFYCAGLNYAEHVMEAAKKLGTPPNLPTQADIGYRANNALIAHDEPVVIPKEATEKIHYEGELVVVIGKKAKHLTMENALDCVLGYTIGNDVSERTWQKSDRTLWRAKNSDTFKPMGPWIDTEFDPRGATTTVKVTGVASTIYKTNEMIFDVPTFLVAMTRFMTLWPGDVVWMGTDGHSPNLVSGDIVEVEISGLGTLRNPFMREA